MADTSVLSQQIAADPRVQAYIAQRWPGGTRGAAEIPGELLRAWGYQVPSGVGVAVQGGRAHVYDKWDGWDTGLMLAGGGLLAGGAAGLAGVGPLAGGASGTTAGAAGAAPTAAGAAGTTAGAAGVLPSSSLPAAGLMGGPAAIASQGVSSAAAGGGFLSQLGRGLTQDPLGALGRIGDVLGQGAAGAAEGRRADALAQATAGRVNLDALALDQRRAFLRSLLGGVQDASIGRPEGSTIPTFNVSGGLRPSALTNRDALMTELSRPAPTVEMPKPGLGEKLMGGAGLAGSILGTLGSLGRQPWMTGKQAY